METLENLLEKDLNDLRDEKKQLIHSKLEKVDEFNDYFLKRIAELKKVDPNLEIIEDHFKKIKEFVSNYDSNQTDNTKNQTKVIKPESKTQVQKHLQEDASKPLDDQVTILKSRKKNVQVNKQDQKPKLTLDLILKESNYKTDFALNKEITFCQVVYNIVQNQGPNKEGRIDDKLDRLSLDKLNIILEEAYKYGLNEEVKAYHFKNVLFIQDNKYILSEALKKGIQIISQKHNLHGKDVIKKISARSIKHLSETIDGREYELHALNNMFMKWNVKQFATNLINLENKFKFVNNPNKQAVRELILDFFNQYLSQPIKYLGLETEQFASLDYFVKNSKDLDLKSSVVFEKDDLVYMEQTKSVKSIFKKEQPALIHSNIENINLIKNKDQKFNLIYLDFVGSLCPSYIKIFENLFEKNKIDDKSVVIITLNNCSKSQKWAKQYSYSNQEKSLEEELNSIANYNNFNIFESVSMPYRTNGCDRDQILANFFYLEKKE